MSSPSRKKLYECLLSVVAGLWIGLITGMSASPVVAMLLGFAGACLPLLLGIRSSGGAQATRKYSLPQNSLLRVIVFGLSGITGMLAGVTIRSYDLLSPSPAHVISRYCKAGFTLPEAKMVMMAERHGIIPESDSSNVKAPSPDKVPAKKEEEPPPGYAVLKVSPLIIQNGSSLFAGSSGPLPEAELLRPDPNIPVGETLKRWRAEEHPTWTKAADEVSAKPVQEQSAWAETVWNILQTLK